MAKAITDRGSNASDSLQSLVPRRKAERCILRPLGVSVTANIEVQAR